MDMQMKYLAVTAAAILSATGTANAAQAKEYKGPIIDAHAHLRLNQTDGLTPTQSIGTDALRKLDEAAGLTKSALIVIARLGQP